MAPPSKPEELGSGERNDAQNAERLACPDSLARAVQDVHITDTSDRQSPGFNTEVNGHGALKREASFDDARTHLSTSSTKQTSFDSKSMASVTTFAMDEKDSLRPDDSASVQAVDEEESLSGPASGAANSLTGSESGVRIYRDHPRDLSSQRPRPVVLPDGGQRRDGVIHADSVAHNFVLPSSAEGFSVEHSLNGFPLEPDEKLLEAMKSPKDRLLILQLEEKVRNFIQNSKEQSLELPPSNAFGRLLAHKLGDYYHLTHFVDNNVTSVRLHRTPFCRLPTPLSVLHAATHTTPPPAVPAMKIMRRNDGDRPSTEGSTAASSSVPSKTTSEVGDSGNDGERGSSAGATPAKDRMALTREEREAKYQEARERIFRDFPETKSSDISDQGTSMSRSSSTSGRKKTHRQKTPHDDSFEARSQFNAYYPGIHYNNGTVPYNVELNDSSFSNQAPYMVGPGMSPPGYAQGAPNSAMYSNHVNLNPLPQYSIPVSPQMTSTGSWQSGAVPQQSPYPGYTSMNQSPVMVTQQSSTKSSPALNNYTMPQYAQMPSTWSSAPYAAGYQPTHRTHPTAHWPNYPSLSPNPTYPYAQYPGQQSLNTAMQAHPNSHPLPGSFARSPFNPQTRSFVPGGTSLARHPSKTSQHNMNSYPPVQPGIQTQWNGYQEPNKKAQEGSAMAQVVTRGGPPSSRDSIAKWGTPSHLPPKPPPSEIPSDFELKHRITPAPSHSYNSNILTNSKNGPLVVSGGTSLPKVN
ncbi:hypothetical protein KXX35_001441 [Aspergillus fumigatus]|nr:hypothetical protein KXX48_009027 [Aspergillus fumigatus]KAH1504379.1 hypothetical protein KXX52_004295 [Aspergillus fumigatus]KAH1796963.1 hypothetical protein KXX20_004158 [Aspergillus fumigatus]KAH1831233.1 hypothetical protein KXX35_001441 [Aspergillus fumigatus]KAH2787456.1 hypothetical protein KXV54_004284 [Aspergillus fumigatus]